MQAKAKDKDTRYIFLKLAITYHDSKLFAKIRLFGQSTNQKETNATSRLSALAKKRLQKMLEKSRSILFN